MLYFALFIYKWAVWNRQWERECKQKTKGQILKSIYNYLENKIYIIKMSKIIFLISHYKIISLVILFFYSQMQYNPSILSFTYLFTKLFITLYIYIYIYMLFFICKYEKRKQQQHFIIIFTVNIPFFSSIFKLYCECCF